jgi:menaquinone-dependent protoporphyrinogen oxidase
MGTEMRILIAVASKHGATTEIAQRIGEELEGRGLEVTAGSADQTHDLAGYDAVVLGSAVYAGHWMAEARDLADRIAAVDPQPVVWVFSSGPVGDPPKPEEDPVDVAGIVEALGARGHQVFAGKIDKSRLSFGERAIVTALRAPVGDYRDWDQIASWAGEIADALGAESAP